uniref:tRNA pseudouridine synthase A n=1 Tax=Roseihalotalea indica TaxID=2867963 RepID=A0AA49GQJ0_9BACT|nr:tRNA pseudouridine(38-40) synthase TruA [Tunicatimonas sp. TK19036]
MRYFISIMYHGAAYHGWQIQQNALSVQQVLNEALSRILQEPIVTTGSGRTDTGVHAKGQVAHFDTNQTLEEADYLYKFNAVLPHDISITRLQAVPDEAHARFSATARSYQYMIHQKKNPFLNGISYFFSANTDIDVMNQAADRLVQYGRRDYTSFSKTNTQNTSFNCHIFRAHWHVIEKDRFMFAITADRFLRGMVRALVGTLLDIGTHTTTLADFPTIIESKDRRKAGRSVDACGLFLTNVTYPADIYPQHD